MIVVYPCHSRRVGIRPKIARGIGGKVFSGPPNEELISLFHRLIDSQKTKDLILYVWHQDRGTRC